MEPIAKNKLIKRRIGAPRTVQASSQGNKFLYITDDRSDNTTLLQKGSNYYSNLRPFFERVERNWRYRRGNQWKDRVYDPNTRTSAVEEDLIKESGQVPLQVNMIAPLVRNSKGQFRSSNSRSNVIARSRDQATIGEMLTNKLRAEYDSSEGWEEDANALEIALCSGFGCQRIDFKYDDEKRKNRHRFENCELMTMFYNPIKKRNLSDMNFVGQIHDLTINDVISKFAKNKDDEAKIRSFYGYVGTDYLSTDNHHSEEWAHNHDFYVPSEPGLCRVYEIWEKTAEWRYWYHDWANAKFGTAPFTEASKSKFDAINSQRLIMAQEYGIDPKEVALVEYRAKYSHFWRFKFITPTYQTLLAGESPYRHKSHPFVFLLFPMIRGEVWGWVEDIIDIQRKFNRDHILNDFLLGSSAKGTLVVDEDSISADFPFEEIVETYSKRNGVIKMKLKAGAQLPQQLVGKAVPAGLHESLQLSMQLMNSNSGVSDAIQGKTPAAGTPASRYAMESQNSTLNSKDFLDAFNAFRTRRDRKMLENIIQFSKEEEYLAISGLNYSDEAKIFDPKKIKEDLVYELQIDQGTDSRVYRAIIDEMLFGWVEKQIIPMEIALKNSSLPFADKILTDLENLRTQAQEGQIPNYNNNMLQNTVNAAQQMGGDPNKANPQAVALMNKYIAEA